LLLLIRRWQLTGGGGLRSPSIAGVARQIDELQHRAVGIVEIGTPAVEHTALPVLLEANLDAISPQMVERRLVLVMRDCEGMMYAPWSSSTELIGGSRFTRMRHVPAASRKAMCPFSVADKCLAAAGASFEVGLRR
jgi:hypothetical protein